MGDSLYTSTATLGRSQSPGRHTRSSAAAHLAQNMAASVSALLSPEDSAALLSPAAVVGIAVGATASCVILASVAACIGCWCWRRQRLRHVDALNGITVELDEIKSRRETLKSNVEQRRLLSASPSHSLSSTPAVSRAGSGALDIRAIAIAAALQAHDEEVALQREMEEIAREEAALAAEEEALEATERAERIRRGEISPQLQAVPYAGLEWPSPPNGPRQRHSRCRKGPPPANRRLVRQLTPPDTWRNGGSSSGLLGAGCLPQDPWRHKSPTTPLRLSPPPPPPPKSPRADPLLQNRESLATPPRRVLHKRHQCEERQQDVDGGGSPGPASSGGAD